VNGYSKGCDVYWGLCACGTYHHPHAADGQDAKDACSRDCGVVPKPRLKLIKGGKPDAN
jgi:hypothetical protein